MEKREIGPVRITRDHLKKKKKANGRPKKKSKAGRPPIITPEVLAKLEMAFSIGCGLMEASAYAGISYDALNDYIHKYPDYRQVIDRLKQKPFLKARQTVVSDLADVDTAKWYLEKKLKNEFGNQQKIEHSGSVPTTIIFKEKKPDGTGN